MKPSFQIAYRAAGHLGLARTSSAIVLTEGDGASTSWIQVCTIGSFKKGDRKFSITTAMLREMVENFSTGTHPVPPTELCVDYEHLSAADTDNPDAGKAAGWFKELELRADESELWARIEWTPPAVAKLQAKEYKFISPEFAFNFTTPAMETIGCTLLAAALTNRPFLQGMEPIALKAATVGDLALVADLSYEQRRMFVERALRKRSQHTSCYCYVVATKDGQVVYEASGQAGYQFYQESYTIGADGEVTLGGDAVEVVVNYEPLGAAALRQSGSQDMKTITLKGTDGKDVQIPEDQLEQLGIVKDLRAQLADRVPKTEVAALQAENVTLTGKVKAIETTLTERDAEAAIEKLVATGKAIDGQREMLKELYLADKAMFEKLTATFTPRVPTGELGSASATATERTATADVNRQVEALRAADPKLTHEAALEKVFAKDGTLYARYVKETEQKVA